jgi:ketosteroid isomerase-like protein
MVAEHYKGDHAMTEQEKNIMIVKNMFEAFQRRDQSAVIDSLSETVEWRCPVTNVLSGTVTWGKPRRGKEGVESFFKELLRDINAHRNEASPLHRAGRPRDR